MAISCCLTYGIPGQEGFSSESLFLNHRSLKQELERYLPSEEPKQQICLSVLKCSQIRAIRLVPNINPTQIFSMERGEKIVCPEIETYAHCLKNRDSISETLTGMDATIIESIESILICFLDDQKTRKLSLTFDDGSGSFVTRSWTKEHPVTSSCGLSR